MLARQKSKKGTTFRSAVLAVVQNIPRGKVMTYAAVAEKAGYPKAARAVANIMASNHNRSIPCHRVVRSDGTVGGYNRGGPKVKYELLQSEGVFTLDAHKNGAYSLK